MVITELADIVNSHVPIFTDFDFLDKYKMFVNNVANVLKCPILRCYIPLSRKHGHTYLEWTKIENFLYTYSELF